MHTPRIILIAIVLAAPAAASVVRGQAQPQGLIVVDDKYEENAAEVFSRIQRITMNERILADPGWEHTVSTVAFKGGLKGYYAEMEAQLR